jgi:hypothetical protein
MPAQFLEQAVEKRFPEMPNSNDTKAFQMDSVCDSPPDSGVTGGCTPLFNVLLGEAL